MNKKEVPIINLTFIRRWCCFYKRFLSILIDEFSSNQKVFVPQPKKCIKIFEQKANAGKKIMTSKIGEQTVNRFSIFYEKKTFADSEKVKRQLHQADPEQRGLKLMQSFIWCNKSRFCERSTQKEIKLSFQSVHGCIFGVCGTKNHFFPQKVEIGDAESDLLRWAFF